MNIFITITGLSIMASFGLAVLDDVSYAGPPLERLSLGSGSVAQVIDDPKAPAPSILTARYGFSALKGFTPYIGTGLAYTLSTDSKTGNNVRFAAGVAGQAGFSYLLGSNSLLNIDYSYLRVAPESKNTDIMPQSIGFGLKFNF